MGAGGMHGNGSVNGRGLSGGGGQPKLDATVARRYNLTLVDGALNILNIVNLGTPNGTLSSPLFGRTQSLADGPFRITDSWQPGHLSSSNLCLLGRR